MQVTSLQTSIHVPVERSSLQLINIFLLFFKTVEKHIYNIFIVIIDGSLILLSQVYKNKLIN